MTARPILALKKRPAQPHIEPVAARSPAAAPSATPSEPENAVAALAWLRGAYPVVFTTAVPLAVGIGRDLAAARPATVSLRGLKIALSRWTHRRDYLRSLAQPGAMRVDPAGYPVEPVADRHREYAATLLARRNVAAGPAFVREPEAGVTQC